MYFVLLQYNLHVPYVCIWLSFSAAIFCYSFSKENLIDFPICFQHFFKRVRFFHIISSKVTLFVFVADSFVHYDQKENHPNEYFWTARGKKNLTVVTKRKHRKKYTFFSNNCCKQATKGRLSVSSVSVKIQKI